MSKKAMMVEAEHGYTKVIQEGAMKDTKKCLEGLGPCSIKGCDEECCKKKCNNYYSGISPYGYCDKYSGYPGYICLCQHDCPGA